MAIPNVPPEALSAAMERFDRELRETPVWADWEQNRAHRYAIEHAGRRYPVKQIISTATGIPVSDFSGGQAAGNANRYAISHGLAVVELRRRNPTWMRDELILALDIYLRYAGNPPRKGSAEIDKLRRYRRPCSQSPDQIKYRRQIPIDSHHRRRQLPRGFLP